jgi:hypothetical protein
VLRATSKTDRLARRGREDAIRVAIC